MLTLFVTVFYPALHSIRAIQSNNGEDDKHWLTYWMVYGIFTFCETFFGFILAFVPYFEWVKLGFFVWLMHPQFNGATIIYNTVLKPYLADHKEQIEELI